MATSIQNLPFHADATELLSLMIHSLYTSKDIFLRELISNASDALDRLRFESLTRPELLEGNNRFEIWLEVNRQARTLAIHDTGMGMSYEEVIENIGTIAKSGTRELRQELQKPGSTADAMDLIGQFGVGFYSAFMVAERVELLTRRAGDSSATEWESSGGGTYTIKESVKHGRGTTIKLHLREPDAETGLEDYIDDGCLARIVKKYSDFINYPIIYKEAPSDLDQHVAIPKENGAADALLKDKVLNSMKPIWKRSAVEIKEEEHIDFYRHISHDWTAPLKTIHFRAEGTFNYDALLYIPGKASDDLYYVSPETGLRLFANRVMIMDKCENLLPRYLRFVRGIVDVGDLPLNISRQRLQQDYHITLIRNRLTRKVLQTLEDMVANEHDKYLLLWREFGRAVKEAVSSDFENKDKIVGLLLFQSSHERDKLTTLSDYVTRMKPEQREIFYLTGESRSMIENSPHLEAINNKGYEVLFMLDTVDELLLQHLTEFDNKRLKSVAKGTIKVGSEDESSQLGDELKQKQEEYRALIEFLEKELSEHIKQVRLSTRLTTSPACLVVEEHDYSPVLERALMKGRRGVPRQRRVFELNPQHPLVSNMRDRCDSNSDDPVLTNAAHLLFGLALLAEGSELSDAIRFSRASFDMLTQVV